LDGSLIFKIFFALARIVLLEDRGCWYSSIILIETLTFRHSTLSLLPCPFSYPSRLLSFIFGSRYCPYNIQLMLFYEPSSDRCAHSAHFNPGNYRKSIGHRHLSVFLNPENSDLLTVFLSVSHAICLTSLVAFSIIPLANIGSWLLALISTV